MLSRPAWILTVIGSIGGLSLTGYGTKSWFKSAVNVVNKKEEVDESDSTEKLIKINQEQILWEYVLTSSRRDRDNKENKFCSRLEKESQEVKEGCNTEWSQGVKSQSGKFELWIRGQEDAIKNSLEKLNLQDKNSYFSEEWESEIFPKLKVVDYLEKFCKKSSNSSKSNLVEYKCFAEAVNLHSTR